MKAFFRCLHGDLYRAFFSLRFFIAVTMVAVACCINTFDSIVIGAFGVLGSYATLQHSLSNAVLLLPICALPGATLFCADWDNRFFRSLAFRTGLRPYGISKVIVCAIVAFCTELIGKFVYFLILVVRFPVLMQSDGKGSIIISGTAVKAFESLFMQHQYFLYFLFCELTIALFCALFAVIALWISTQIPNIFVIIASPIIVYYLIAQVSYYIGLPDWLNPISIRNGYSMGGSWLSLLYAFVFFNVLIMIFGLLFEQKARWRIQNE